MNCSGTGIPQGTPISAVLSNVFALDIDRTLVAAARTVGAFYRRYSDDLFIVCNASEAAALERQATQIMEDAGLSINRGKMQRYLVRGQSITHASEEWTLGGPGAVIDYLGLTWNGKQVGIRPASLSRYLRRRDASVRSALRKAGGQNDALWRRKLYMRYSHLGAQGVTTPPARSPRNFVGYALRAKARATQRFDIPFSPRVGKLWMELDELVR